MFGIDWLALVRSRWFIGVAGIFFGIVSTLAGYIYIWGPPRVDRGSSTLCAVADCGLPNLRVSPRLVCEGETVSVAWRPDLSRCSPLKCYQPRDNSPVSIPPSPIECRFSTDCDMAHGAICLDGRCQWDYCAAGATRSCTLGENPCPMNTCVYPTRMTIDYGKDGVWETPVNGDLRQSGRISITPQAGIQWLSLLMNAGRYYQSPSLGGVGEEIVVVTAEPTQALARLACNTNPATRTEWKYRVTIPAPASSRIRISAIVNPSDRAFVIRLPEGLERTLPAGGTVDGFATHVRGAILAKDHPDSESFPDECANTPPRVHWGLSASFRFSVICTP